MLNTLLMLSGGKDSCTLAYDMYRDGKSKTTVLFTNDPGFLSQVALDNIEKVCRDTGMRHIFHKTKDAQRTIVHKFFESDNLGMWDVCAACTKITTINAVNIALGQGIRDIVTGSTKFNFVDKIGTSWVKLHNGLINLYHPNVEKYDPKHVMQVCEMQGIVWDPRKTNCKYIKRIIQTHYERFGENPYQSEINGLYAAGYIDENTKQKYVEFCTGEGESK